MGMFQGPGKVKKAFAAAAAAVLVAGTSVALKFNNKNHGSSAPTLTEQFARQNTTRYAPPMTQVELDREKARVQAALNAPPRVLRTAAEIADLLDETIKISRFKTGGANGVQEFQRMMDQVNLSSAKQTLARRTLAAQPGMSSKMAIELREILAERIQDVPSSRANAMKEAYRGYIKAKGPKTAPIGPALAEVK